MKFWDYEVRTDPVNLNRELSRITRIARIIESVLLRAKALESACLTFDK